MRFWYSSREATAQTGLCNRTVSPEHSQLAHTKLANEKGTSSHLGLR